MSVVLIAPNNVSLLVYISNVEMTAYYLLASSLSVNLRSSKLTDNFLFFRMRKNEEVHITSEKLNASNSFHLNRSQFMSSFIQPCTNCFFM